LVTDLAAERSGDRVILRWTTPSRTTDDLEIPTGAKGAMVAEVCREAGAPPKTPVARRSACLPILHLAVAPGPSSVVDDLPPELRRDPVGLLGYRVQVANSAGRSAGESVAAFAASGVAPPAVDSLQAHPAESGAVIEWESGASGANVASIVELTRVDISTDGKAISSRKTRPVPQRRPGKKTPSRPSKNEAPEPDEVRLRTPDAASSSVRDQAVTHGTVDATAVPGKTYRYLAERVRTVTLDSHTLEIHSAPSPAVTVSMRDTFAPKSPTGLAAIPSRQSSSAGGGSAAIDLSWEANGEPDLAGYFVYRQLARTDGSPEGPFVRLNPAIISAPAFRDVAVSPGQRYIYQVTAVDAAGNESAPSPKAQEVADSP
jgi:hypothetical protein